MLRSIGTAVVMVASLAVADPKPADSIGQATMLKDGTLVLTLRAEGPNAAKLRIGPKDASYASTLEHLGRDMKPGSTRPVKPFPSKTQGGRAGFPSPKDSSAPSPAPGVGGKPDAGGASRPRRRGGRGARVAQERGAGSSPRTTALHRPARFDSR